MEKVSIYQAKIGDTESVYNNIKKCADEMASQGLEHWIPYYPKEKIREDIQINKVYLVQLKEMVIGNFILMFDFEERKIQVGKLAIIPEYAGKGIGSECLRFIEQYAKINNLKAIELDVYEKSTKAIKFYEKNGYKIIGDKATRRFRVKKMIKELIN